jgi:hypothetical protein
MGNLEPLSVYAGARGAPLNLEPLGVRSDYHRAVMSSRRPIRVSLSGDRFGDYVVAEERPDGSLVLEPDGSGPSTARRRRARPGSGGLAALFSGMLTNTSGDRPQTVPEILEEWGVKLRSDEQVRDFLSLEVNGVGGFAAITTARLIFVSHAARGPVCAREFPLATLLSAELSPGRGRQRLRVSWASGETTIEGARETLDRLNQALIG